MRTERKESIDRLWESIIHTLTHIQCVPTMALFVDDDDELQIVPIHLPTPDDTECTFDYLNKVVSQKKPAWVAVAVDTWTSTNGLRPSEDPNRKNTVAMVVIEPSGCISFSRLQSYIQHNGKVALGTVSDRAKDKANQRLQKWLQPWATDTN